MERNTQTAHNPTTTSPRTYLFPTTTTDMLMEHDYSFRTSVQNESPASLYKPYVPTDFHEEDDELLGGWDESVGTCPDCHMLRAAAQTCFCI